MLIRIYRTPNVRKFYSYLKFMKPFLFKLFPNYFKYNTLKYWKEIEGPHFFDYWKKNYESKGLWKIQEEQFIEQLKHINFDSILEYGCGYGRILKLIEANFPQAAISGCDISKHQIENGKKYLGKQSKCNLFVIEDIIVPENSNEFDVVFTVDVLLHQTHNIIDEVRDELYRVSKKYIVLFEGTFSNEDVNKDKLYNKHDKTCYKHNHIQYFEQKNCKILKNILISEVGNNFILIAK